MNPYLAKEIEELHQMVEYLDQFEIEMNNEKLPFHKRQAMAAAYSELKKVITIKMNDIRRRLGK